MSEVSADSPPTETKPVSGGLPLERLALDARIDVLKMIERAKSSHVGSCFSCVELLVSLYFRHLRIDPRDPADPLRDRFLMSKGHAAAAYYAILAARGFFSRTRLDTFYLDGGDLKGHVDAHGVPGVETSHGSLGHGLAIGVGMALAAKHDAVPWRTFVLMSDGECNEGSVWEAALAGAAFGLDNLIAIVDFNRQQGMGSTEDIIPLEPLAEKWRAFGWNALDIDGHDFEAIAGAMRQIGERPGVPTAIVARTTKGKGVSFMEHNVLWHYRTATGTELAAALEELGCS